ncbi:MAG: putative aminohydrolase SsnA [Acidobacteriota bacterium]
MGSLVISNATVATLGADNQVLDGHDVVCRDGVIEAVVPHRPTPPAGVERTIDARGRLVMPGFINAHMHFYSTLVRGLGKAAPSRDFTEVLKHLWWRLDRKLLLEDCYVSALIPLLAAIRHGTTTLIDHHASPGAVRGSLDAIARAVKETGLRASLCYEVSDRDGEGIAREGLEENVAFIRRLSGEPDPQLRALFGLHASFTLGERTLARAASLGHELGAGFHIHVAEAESDQRHCLDTHGCRVVERLLRHGILGPLSIAAHCVHVSEWELDLLAETAAAVVHNPQSNMNNAVGVADILRMFAKGILVGLGTDAMTVNMLEEVRSALWAQRLLHRHPSVAFVEALSTLANNNASIASRYWDPPVGELRPGFAADLIILDYEPPTPLTAGTFLGHLAFGLPLARVATTIVGGKVLMEEGRLLIDADEARIAARSRELAAALWERF